MYVLGDEHGDGECEPATPGLRRITIVVGRLIVVDASRTFTVRRIGPPPMPLALLVGELVAA